MARALAALALVAAVAAWLALVSGGSGADPRTPAALPGLPPPFLGTAVVGDGRATAAVDAYGDVVDLRRSPAGRALLAVPAARQVAETVAPEMAIVPRLRLDDGRALPFWRADSVTQRYAPGTNVLVTTARFGQLRASVTYAPAGGGLICLTSVNTRVTTTGRLRCERPGAPAALKATARSDRRWLAASSPLAAAAPRWAAGMYERSLLVLRALTDDRTGAVAAGARDGWAYVWPRDAATAALALRAAGHDAEARRTARFLRGLDLGAAARFRGDGTPVLGRASQGDAVGWVRIAAERAGLTGGGTGRAAPHESDTVAADYQEKATGDYLGNAIAATAVAPLTRRRAAAAAISNAFASSGGLDRIADEPGSGVDSAAAWAVRPFALPALYPGARASLRRLLAHGDRFGIVPSADWPDRDPWTAPTAWSAWAFAALARADARSGHAALARSDRDAALTLLGDLRRAATPAGTLPERVDARTGVPRSTTPLAWSHAFAVLALRELWPAR